MNTANSLITRPARAQRFEIAQRADHCVKWLEIQGFKVLYIQKGSRRPLIIIQACSLCDQLEGTIAVYERGLTYERRYKKVTRLHCEVRWDDLGSMPGGGAA